MEATEIVVQDSLFVSHPTNQNRVREQIQGGRRAETLEPRAIKTVCVSVLAAMKMLTHAKQGVQDGIAATGVPVEVMGLLFGYPGDTVDTLIVQDAFPVPCKGGPHSAEMDPQTPLYMQDLGELLEQTRPHGTVCGWYHSHPFEPLPEVDGHHCWFSDTDVSNQNQWQTLWESMAGRPFVGVVVDPQTSMLRNKLQLAAFRNFPPYHTNSADCPDGRPLATETQRTARWGSAWRAYYELQIRCVTFVCELEAGRRVA
jgi:COP9 signalosome complex subunit 5